MFKKANIFEKKIIFYGGIKLIINFALYSYIRGPTLLQKIKIKKQQKTKKNSVNKTILRRNNYQSVRTLQIKSGGSKSDAR